MLYEEWKSRCKNLKNFNTVLQRCPRFWPLAPPRGMNPGVYSLGISEDPPRYLSSKFDASVRSDCWDISIWKTLTQCDGNGNANANVDDRGDYNSSPCTSYRRAKNGTSCSFAWHSALSRARTGQLSVSMMWLGGISCQSVWGKIFQWGSTLKVSIELPVTSRHMMKRLLKVTLSPKQTNK